MPTGRAEADHPTWDDFPIVTEPRSTWVLSETGWSAVTAWLAGPAWVMRRSARPAPPVVVVRPTEAGNTRSKRPRSAAEQAEIDDEIDDFLAASGFPKRPRGYEWHLRTIPTMNEREFWSYLNEQINETDASASSSPRDVAEHLHQILSRLLAR